MALDLLRRLSPSSGETNVDQGPSKRAGIMDTEGDGQSPRGWSLSQQFQESQPNSHDTILSPSSVNPPNGKQASPVKNLENLHCTSKCQFNRVLGNRKKLQCSLCMKFYHYKCVDEDPKSTLVWSCFDCRNISQDVQAIKEQVNCISSKIDSLSQGNVLDMLLTLQKQINILVNEQKSLQSTNADLIHRLRIVTRKGFFKKKHSCGSDI